MKLPTEFSDLQDLADAFAISDDIKRGKIVEGASEEALKQLVARVWPRLGEINHYLDDHSDDEACLLGTLAEVACEVQIELGLPSSS